MNLPFKHRDFKIKKLKSFLNFILKIIALNSKSGLKVPLQNNKFKAISSQVNIFIFKKKN